MIFFAEIMSLYFTSLNSGSNGNCYYVGTTTDAVLIDVGLSCRETEKRMKQLGLEMKTVKAIFVSHEQPPTANYQTSTAYCQLPTVYHTTDFLLSKSND